MSELLQRLQGNERLFVERGVSLLRNDHRQHVPREKWEALTKVEFMKMYYQEYVEQGIQQGIQKSEREKSLEMYRELMAQGIPAQKAEAAIRNVRKVDDEWFRELSETPGLGSDTKPARSHSDSQRPVNWRHPNVW
ncbi:MAG: hypothetical protein LBR11_00340 [Deltaproteobacteria bacterium]|jgi:hypothetical protein|nr:hypothetical protein [Deltaproteobacteria bacterium]